MEEIAIREMGPTALMMPSLRDSQRDFLENNISSHFGVMAFCAAICIVAGCFVDGTATCLLLTPIFLPVCRAMGIDLMAFSMVFMISIMSGGMTPPVGSMLFIIGAIDDIPISKMVKPVLPFIGILIVVCVLIMLFPGIASWLPSLIYG